MLEEERAALLAAGPWLAPGGDPMHETEILHRPQAGMRRSVIAKIDQIEQSAAVASRHRWAHRVVKDDRLDGLTGRGVWGPTRR